MPYKQIRPFFFLVRRPVQKTFPRLTLLERTTLEEGAQPKLSTGRQGHQLNLSTLRQR